MKALGKSFITFLFRNSLLHAAVNKLINSFVLFLSFKYIFCSLSFYFLSYKFFTAFILFHLAYCFRVRLVDGWILPTFGALHHAEITSANKKTTRACCLIKVVLISLYFSLIFWLLFAPTLTPFKRGKTMKKACKVLVTSSTWFAVGRAFT